MQLQNYNVYYELSRAFERKQQRGIDWGPEELADVIKRELNSTEVKQLIKYLKTK